MGTLGALVKRNMIVYLRNKGNVFFSLLTVLIILALNAIFLGSVADEKLAYYIIADQKIISYATGSWLMAGIIVVNAFMVTTMVLTLMVQDEEKHKLAAFITAPVSKVILTLSYSLAACLASLMFSVITLLISQLYLYFSCGYVISILACCKIIGLMIANIFSVVGIVMCAAAIIRTTSSFGAFATAMGSVIGFLAGIYLPIGGLPESVQNGLKLFPIMHGAAVVRDVYTEAAIKMAFLGIPQQAAEQYKKYMGIRVYLGDHVVTCFESILILLVSGIVFTGIAACILSRKKTSDR